MKSVRLFYRKKGRLRFVSHLDMNRLFIRLFRKTRLPLWYSEGFNPRPRIQFALPLSLGFESEWDTVDVRLDDDAFANETVLERMQAVAPEGLEIFAAADPIRKTGEVAFASFSLTVDLPEETAAFFAQEEIPVEKRTKKGGMKSVNIRPWIREWAVREDGLDLTLSAGVENLNPLLVLEALSTFCGRPVKPSAVCRTALLDADGKKFA